MIIDASSPGAVTPSMAGKLAARGMMGSVPQFQARYAGQGAAPGDKAVILVKFTVSGFAGVEKDL